MYVLGHVGISLFLYAPIAGLLLSAGQPVGGALTGLLMVGLAPLPDLDTYTDCLDHRGPTHTVWFALGVGLVVAIVTGGGMVIVDSVAGVDQTPLWIGGWFGAVSTLAVLGHLVGDLVTPMGLWPFRPLSAWHYTFDLTPSKSPRANRLCFASGVVALLSTTLLVTLI